MASIFSLFGEVFIDNEKAIKSLDETSKKGEESGSKVGSAFGSIVKGAAAVGTAVVGAATTFATAAFGMANNTAEYCDIIDKLSERTGINREELQRWKHAADQSGVSVDAFKTATKKMSDVLADAQAGSGTAQAAIEGLGLSLDDLVNASPEEAFNQITMALADMEQGTARNALGADIFGKAYTEMLPLLNAGSEGITALKQEADNLGIVMSEDAVKAGVLFGDTLANVKDAAGGLMNQLGAALFPVLQTVLDFILENLPLAQAFIGEITPIITMLFSELLPPLMDLAKQLFPVIIDLIMQLLPFIMQIITDLLPVIVNLLQMFLPPILQIVEKILPLLLKLIEPILPLLDPIFKLLQPLIDILMALLIPLIDLLDMILPPIIELLTTIISVILPPLQKAFELVAGVVSGVFKSAFEALQPIIESIMKILGGLIDFITGIFTGDWSKAWEGVKKIFQGIFDALVGIFKMPINFIIDGINFFIGALNKIKIPDWVPGIGGLGFNIPLIQKLRVGMEYVPYDEMPALLHKGEQVLTASEADAYRNGRNGVTINIYYPNFTNEGEVDRIMDEVVSRLRLAGVKT